MVSRYHISNVDTLKNATQIISEGQRLVGWIGINVPLASCVVVINKLKYAMKKNPIMKKIFQSNTLSNFVSNYTPI